MKNLNSVDFLCSIALGFVQSSGFNQEYKYENISEVLREIFRDFILQTKPFEQCANLLQNLIGRIDPLIRLQELLEIPETPLVYKEDPSDLFLSGSRRKTRTWTTIEDQRLLAGVARYGTDNWLMVSKFLGNGRNRSQCAQRWSRCLNPQILKKTIFT